jgi:hypothetical protein
VIEVDIPLSIKYIQSNIFYTLPNLKTIYVAPDHDMFALIDGVLFEKANRRLVAYPRGFKAKSYTIPQGIEIVGASAFEGNVVLTEIIIPNTVKVISDAFSGSGKIEEIVIGKSVTLISQYAFSGCTKLKSVQILGKVKKIENCAFLGCISLESIRLPNTITEIGENAFSNCSSLNTVTYEGTSESWYKIPVAKGNLNLQAAEMIFEGKK